MAPREKDGGKDFLDITALIRSIQRAESKPDCFRRGDTGNCDRFECVWRTYCLQEEVHEYVKKNNDERIDRG